MLIDIDRVKPPYRHQEKTFRTIWIDVDIKQLAACSVQSGVGTKFAEENPME